MFRFAHSAGLVALGAFATLATSVSAASLDGYSSLLVFGDSLSDPGNLLASAAPPAPPYYQAAPGGANPLGAGVRFSDGPVWADMVAGETPLTLNFAFGGARAASDGPSFDLPEQFGLFALYAGPATAGDNDLATIWLGANDIFDTISRLASSPSADPVAEVMAAGVAAAQAVVGAAQTLIALGVETVAVFNLPELDKTPAYQSLGDPARAWAEDGTNAFNGTLAALLATVPGGTIVPVDIESSFAALIADPEAFGFSPDLSPCIGTGDCGGEDPRVFFDGVHPTTAAHMLVAQELRDALHPAPVPLPAGAPLVLMGLGALAVARGRRQVASGT